MVRTGRLTRLQRRALVLGGLIAALLGLSASASAATLPEALSFWGMPPDGLSVKPHQLVWATDVSQPNFAGTASAGSRLQWSSWTATSASGSGALWVPKLLPPNGSKVSWKSYPATLDYSAPKTLTVATKLNATGAPYKTVKVFSKLTVTFTGAVPPRWSRSANFRIRAYHFGKRFKGFYHFTFPT